MQSKIKILFTRVYNLKGSEFDVIFALLKEKDDKELTIQDLVKKIGKDRTTIQKVATSLVKKKLLYIRQENLTRGFHYKYSLYERESLFKKVEKMLKEDFENDIQSITNLKKKYGIGKNDTN